MTTFQVRYKICCVKTWCLFPPLRILAEHTLQIAMALSSSATVKNFQTGEDMFTNDDVMSATRAESHLRSESRWISDKSDWLIDLPASYFIGSSYRISFIYRSNKNDVISPYRSIIYLSDNIVHPYLKAIWPSQITVNFRHCIWAWN